MTYTYKLARRLAVSRNYGMIALLMFAAACAAGDTVSPVDSGTDWRNREAATVDITPDTLTLEVNQSARFVGRVRSPGSDSVDNQVEWSATGGTISSDGLFKSSQTGTYQVIGRGKTKSDTSVVTVVASQPTLASLTISPATVSLMSGATQQFAVAAKLSDGSTTTVGVVWTATGGSIDASGKYTAGSTGGQYRVIVANTGGTVADTAAVTVTVPVLTNVVLTPGSTSLSTGATAQFAAYGRMSNGDSVAVAVAFSATGGTITSSGLYTAGSTAGTYRVIASASGLADTSAITLSAPVTTTPTPTPTPTSGSLGVGIPFGTFDLLAANVAPGPFTLSHDSYSASNIVSRITAAQASHSHLVLAMTNGSHSNYLTNGVFDRSKWEARMQTFNTPEIKQAIAAGVADGTILGASVMDEPQVSGTGDGNTWGPPGTMTKARVDSLCGYVKMLFPTLPAGVVHRHDVFEPQNSYYVCEFIVSQYSSKIGSVTTFRDGGLAMAKRDGIGIIFSMNILNGGTQDKDGTWDCIGTGGLGTYSPNCRMTPDQVRTFGSVLGPAGCGFLMWRYDDQFMANPDNQLAFRAIANQLATLPRKSCGRA